jgi:hypothetical protein
MIFRRIKKTCPACQLPDANILDLPDNTTDYWKGNDSMDKWCMKHRARRGYLENLERAAREVNP